MMNVQTGFVMFILLIRLRVRRSFHSMIGSEGRIIFSFYTQKLL